jgi:hypothetical protein
MLLMEAPFSAGMREKSLHLIPGARTSETPNGKHVRAPRYLAANCPLGLG